MSGVMKSGWVALLEACKSMCRATAWPLWDKQWHRDFVDAWHVGNVPHVEHVSNVLVL